MDTVVSLKRVKVVIGHQGIADFLADCTLLDDGDLKYLGTIPRQARIPSPYASAPEHQVMEWNGKPVIVVETRHRRHEVFEVEPAAIQPLQEES